MHRILPDVDDWREMEGLSQMLTAVIGTKPTTSALQRLRLLSVALLTSHDMLVVSGFQPADPTRCHRFDFYEFTT
jgi:hypothetical protein